MFLSIPLHGATRITDIIQDLIIIVSMAPLAQALNALLLSIDLI